MTHQKTFLAVLFFALCLILEPAQAARFYGKVVAIHDGDTINIILNNGKKARVRLLGTDSPEIEIHQQTQGEVAYQARDFLRWMLPLGSDVVINTSSEIADKHNRLLGQVMYNGQDLNREMLRNGWSAFYLIAPYDKTMARQYSQVCQEAYNNRRGIFSDRYADTLMPYMFRMVAQNMTGRNLVGNLQTRELYAGVDVEQVPPCLRVFFPNEHSAQSRGFHLAR